MEVDSVLPTAAQSSDARHPSSYSGIATTSTQGSIFNHSIGGRKRRRSSRLRAISPSSSLDGRSFENTLSQSREEQSIEDEGIGTRLAKRRRDMEMMGAEELNGSHHYRALGSASVLNSSSHDNEYGVDSPMYSLSLASPSPPLPQSPDGLMENDMDMGDDDNIHTIPLASASASASMTDSHSKQPLIPRQVRIGRLNSTAPLRPSPLVHSEKFLSSSTQGSPSSNQGIFSSQSVTSTDADTDRRQIAENDYTQDTSPPRRDSPHLMRRALHQSSRASDGTDSSDRGDLLEPSRTPSPGPMNVYYDAKMGDSRKLHHSPGLSQTFFPGGKQLLRYTMGYREDCSACKSKTPGHYGHVMHH